MKEQFVPYELALKLKKIGFNEPCIFAYCINKSNNTPSILESSNPFGELNDPLDWNNMQKGYYRTIINYNKEDVKCSALLWGQAFNWFREKYKFKVGIGINDKGLYYDYKIVLFNTTDAYYKDCYNTYTEARLACLEKLIELCKKN